MVEIIGYIGSVLIAASLMMSNIKRLRIVNLIGALVFVGYALMVKAYPIVLVNGFIAVIDAYYLGLMRGRRDYFKLMPAQSMDDRLVKLFLEFHREDIHRFFPKFLPGAQPGRKAIFILRNLQPVGLFIYYVSDGAAHIELDYVAPEYRDFKNANYFLYTYADTIRSEGATRFLVHTQYPAHVAYMEKMGFTRGADGVYSRDI